MRNSGLNYRVNFCTFLKIKFDWQWLHKMSHGGKLTSPKAIGWKRIGGTQLAGMWWAAPKNWNELSSCLCVILRGPHYLTQHAYSGQNVKTSYLMYVWLWDVGVWLGTSSPLNPQPGLQQLSILLQYEGSMTLTNPSPCIQRARPPQSPPYLD